MSEVLDLQPSAEESLDLLSLGRRVLQRRKGHRSATDDLIAAWVGAKACPGARQVLDLGCGHGTVTLHLSEVLEDACFVGVEVNPISLDLARRNILLNGLKERVQLIGADLRGLPSAQGWLHEGGFDLVTGTPPFMPLGSGALAQDPQRRAARFELNGGIEDYCLSAARFVAAGGWVSMVMDGAQHGRVCSAFRQASLQICRVLAVVPRAGKAARYLAYLGQRAAMPQVGSSVAAIDGELVVRNEQGQLTQQMRSLRSFLRLPRAT